MKKSWLVVLLVSALISGCSFPPGSSPVEASPTSTATIQPTFTASPIPPTETPAASLGTIALDFVALLCDAQWMNGGQHLGACPDLNADHSGGYAVAVDPLLEDLPAGTPVLLTIPASNGFAALFLRYPSLAIHAGDRFRTFLRCQAGSACDVEFALEYYDAQGKYVSPWLAWNFKQGDADLVVDADLGAIAGQTVDLVLTLRPGNDQPLQDRALWIAPYIYRSNP